MSTATNRWSGGLLAGCLLLAAAAAPADAQATDRDAKIDRAMEAAPAEIAEEATIKAVDGTVLREGSNGWTCLPEAFEGHGYPMCNDDVWMAVREAMLSQSEPSIERVGISYMLAGDARVNNADPSDTVEDEGEVWVREGPHLMLAVPDPALLEGIPTDPHQGGPYVMWAGTPYAHVMVPTGPKPEQ